MTDTQSELVLVTGATGRHGGTSGYVVTDLLQAGKQVRVLARTESERTRELADAGAEVVFGDYNDRQSLIAALEGVNTATFTYPVAGGIVPAAANFASAAREGGRTLRLVVMSMAVSHPNSPSPLGRAQWLAEEILSWAGLDLCILRIGAVFFENLTAAHAAQIRETSTFANSFGIADVPWISGLDAARLVTAAVLRPELFPWGPVHYPPGAEATCHHEVADALAAMLDRPIWFNSISREEWQRDLLKLSERHDETVVNPDMAKHIPAVGAALQSAKAPIVPVDPKELERLTGKTPLSLVDFLLHNRDLFTAQESDDAARVA
ncbi:NmrA family NAD(P)-binding protein [Rhizobium wenxiniae]|uniref:NmrA family NAD(P)-binding protein n=1 Tax=Rhizobium wenxiniae TaxID=1737357 RepID=UPI003C214A14